MANHKGNSTEADKKDIVVKVDLEEVLNALDTLEKRVDAINAKVEALETLSKTPASAGTSVSALEARIAKIETRVNPADASVEVPQKKNYNPDYLPHGVQGVKGLEDLPQKNA